MRFVLLLALMLLVGCGSSASYDCAMTVSGSSSSTFNQAARDVAACNAEQARQEAQAREVERVRVLAMNAAATDAARPTITPTPTMEPTVMPTPTMEPTRTPEPVVVIVVVTPVVTPTTEPTATPILSVRTRSSRTMQDVGLLVVIGIVLIGLGCLGYLFLRPRTRTGPNEE